jgi:ribosome-associated protein
MDFTLDQNHEYIQLNQLLKLLNLAESGGEANQFIIDGLVRVNGTTEFQKRKKLRGGDIVQVGSTSISIL